MEMNCLLARTPKINFIGNKNYRVGLGKFVVDIVFLHSQGYKINISKAFKTGTSLFPTLSKFLYLLIGLTDNY